jgi:cytochrome P450
MNVTQTRCPVHSIDHHSAEFAERRHDIFAELRRDAPIAMSDCYGGFYIAASYKLGRHILRDDEHFSVSRFEDGTGGLLIPAVMKSPKLRPGELDGAEHLAYRKALHDRFKPTTVKMLQPFVQRIVDETLDAVISKRQFDAMHDLAAVIPARVVLEYLGVPRDSQVSVLEGLALGFRAAPDTAEATDDTDQFRAVWRDLLEVIAEKRRSPGDDVMSTLVRSDLNLTDEQLLSVVMNVALGGTVTTTSWMSYAMMFLEQHRDLRARLIENPDDVAPFGEELLRWFSPASSLARNVIQDTEVGDVPLKQGDRVYVAITSLNRDDDVFEDAGTFDIDRERKQHMAFGVGAHFCLGVHLARLEFRIFIQSLLSRLPDYSIDVVRSEHNQSAGVTPRWLKLPASTNLGESP